MKIRLERLIIHCRYSAETIEFTDFTVFYGKMGAGKSSISQLIDYCLGAKINLTPVLQSQFNSARLHLKVNEIDLLLSRERDSDQILAQWQTNSQDLQIIVPARRADGEVIPDSGVEILSDLLFYLSDIIPPKVRRSRLREDSELARLTIRDLLWYCYLDQDSIDSNFFHLEAEADVYRRNKSRDVLRFILGFHQERVAELESELEAVRTRRLKFLEGSKALRDALAEAKVANELDIQNRIAELKEQLEKTVSHIADMRKELRVKAVHAVDDLRAQGRQAGTEIESLENAIRAIDSIIDEDTRHRNELTILNMKFRRATTARAVLNGVEFEACPRCAQNLPEREEYHCRLCDQPDIFPDSQAEINSATERDIESRTKELSDSIQRHQQQLVSLRQQLRDRTDDKNRIDRELNVAMEQYDSAFLSQAIALEHTRAALEQEIIQLGRISALPRKVETLLASADSLVVEESKIRRELTEARSAAEQDTTNLKRLQKLFLDCLVRARVPGINPDDRVEIRSPHFLPKVISPEEGDLVFTSFANISSGGKKTLFKCCFVLAVHILATERSALIPRLLIIDSPMKSISTNENREQFEGFYELLYDLADNELKDTQFILIDNEFSKPTGEYNFELKARHLTLDNPAEPPLVSYRMEIKQTEPAVANKDEDAQHE